MRTSEVLRAGRANVEARWWDGNSPRQEGQTCGAWAIWLVPEVGGWDPVHPALLALVRVVGGQDQQDVFDFNDSHSRDEVLAAFDAAIANEEAREQEFSPSACQPVDPDRWDPELVAEALAAPYEVPAADRESAWKDMA